ncbi:MAG: LysR family transcriptional regulator [Cyanobium sp. M30B3]|jgi:DNA-binding transcriptional LysR family regulator|nr:MAG: LysR family transcriptional regulator [Cyanobium sp. M30B3]
MFSLDQLAALDLTLWMGTGAAAAQQLGVNQSTVSRQQAAVLRLLGLRLVRRPGALGLKGDLELLRAERVVQQLARLKGLAPLRVDANYASGPWLLNPVPNGWISGRFDLPGLQRPLELLRERVLDAWVCSYQPDLPSGDDPEWWVLDLLEAPLQLLASPDHPLAAERQLRQSDLERFPSLALPAGWFPRTETHLRQQGLWRQEVHFQRYDQDDWEGRSRDGVTLLYGNSLTERLMPCTIRLDWDLQLISGDALVVRRDVADQPAIQQLAACLQVRSRLIAAQFADVQALN